MGCGVVGLGGLIIGVALVVWLGSIALSGTTGGSGGGSGSDAESTVPVTEAATGEPVGARLSVAPATDLGERGQVSAKGTGFAPGSIELSVCLAFPLDGKLACADGGGTGARVSEQGTFDRALEIRRVLLVDNTPYDCGARPGACVLRSHRVDGPPDQGVAIPLAFSPALPPADAEPPPG